MLHQVRIWLGIEHRHSYHAHSQWIQRVNIQKRAGQESFTDVLRGYSTLNTVMTSEEEKEILPSGHQASRW